MWCVRDQWEFWLEYTGNYFPLEHINTLNCLVQILVYLGLGIDMIKQIIAIS